MYRKICHSIEGKAKKREFKDKYLEENKNNMVWTHFKKKI
jgi:hypothetical protein